LEVNTYPEMNESIKKILKTGSGMDLYVAKRIEELEAMVEQQKHEIERYGKALQEIHSTVQLTELDINGECEIEAETALRNIENIVIEAW
jgi:predicted RNase H-like nuclease (RuvC/YqgF family)